MSDEPKYRDEEWLREQYVEKRRTTTDIAGELGCSQPVISKWLNRYDIETRNGGPAPSHDLLKDGEWLREQYVSHGRSTTDIAEELGCCANTVIYWMERHGLSRRVCTSTATYDILKDGSWLREQYKKRGRTTVDIADGLGCTSATVSSWLNKHRIDARGPDSQSEDKLKEEGWLREQYIDNGRRMVDIANSLGCSVSSVSYWLRKKGIKTRSRGAGSGAEHPNWSGGEVPYGAGWNDSKKRQVRERDGHECVDCGTTQAEHKAEYDQKLHVHHLIKARDIDDPEERNAPENLITLCRDCHREWERLSEAGIRPQIDGVTAD